MSSAAEMFSAAEMLLAAGAVKRSQQGLPRSGRFLTRTGHFPHRSLTGILSCQCPFLVPRPVPSMDEGNHAWQRVFPALFVLFVLAGVSLAPKERRSAASARICRLSPPASQKPKITRKYIAGRCIAVLSEQKCVQTRKGPQRILAVLSRGLTQYGRISARQNRICPCQSMAPLFLCSYYGRRSGGIGMCEQHPKGPAAKWAQQERWGERPNRAFCPGTYLYKRVFCCISS